MLASRSKPCSSRAGFTLVELMIVVAIIGIIVAIALPGWIRARNLSRQRACQENLVKIDGAKEQWALESRKSTADVPTEDDLFSSDGTGYLKAMPLCPVNGTYTYGSVGVDALCSITTAPYDHNAKP